ncbi:ABC transporter substrate-binding protein [Actinospica durhamensis]|uniref:ABC transporter substrate-binding protein n=1 Tax=Actinospica durhamensis TaxID=1508375 RepID=A0A941IMG5_9ACTN|nr:ABC transporter substrate-binding protein [Actinospica durhamensis]MBR7832829.1 ABC transporter substrate-binding protein [Actinospica durhamensis]
MIPPPDKGVRPPNLTRRSLVALGLGAGVTALTAWGGGSGRNLGGAGTGASGLTQVSLALDWTPNTNHTGIYVAQQLGYFAQRGLDLRIVPYGSTAPEVLVSTHKADFGISYQDGLTEAAVSGGDIVSVFAITQKTDVCIGVRADSSITSPAQLDGKTYAGYGGPMEVPMLQYVIKAAGGTGQFKNVTLNTDAYQALYAGQADFAMPEPTWEVIQAAMVGKPLRTFDVTAYGFPAIYSAIIASSNRYLVGNGDLARRFLAAIEEGYAYATAHPTEAANLLIQANESVLGTQRALVLKSAQLEASEYYKDTAGQIGYQSQDRWQALTDFMFRNGILTDASGKPITTEPKVSTLFTNAYLPASVTA